MERAERAHGSKFGRMDQFLPQIMANRSQQGDFYSAMMADQGGIGNQLLHQRPDLVRRAWVPVLVGIFFPLFYDLHLLR